MEYVLHGGGIKGAAHIGVIKALEEENINFKYVAGTSSGSIIASLYSLGYKSNEIYELFNKYSKKIKYMDFFNIVKAIVGIIFFRKILINGLNSGKTIEKIVNEASLKKGKKYINELNKTVLIPSVDLHNGRICVFSSKNIRNTYIDDIIYTGDIEIGKAVRASCSYPGVFSPCKWKETELIDGGIRENVPWKELKKVGAKNVINIVFEGELKENSCKNIVDVVSGSIGILCHELSNYELEGADYLLKIKTKEKIGLLDTSKIDYLYELGYETARKNMQEIKKIIK